HRRHSVHADPLRILYLNVLVLLLQAVHQVSRSCFKRFMPRLRTETACHHSISDRIFRHASSRRNRHSRRLLASYHLPVRGVFHRQKSCTQSLEASARPQLFHRRALHLHLLLLLIPRDLLRGHRFHPAHALFDRLKLVGVLRCVVALWEFRDHLGHIFLSIPRIRVIAQELWTA